MSSARWASWPRVVATILRQQAAKLSALQTVGIVPPSAPRIANGSVERAVIAMPVLS
jgi:hypothetical protein